MRPDGAAAGLGGSHALQMLGGQMPPGFGAAPGAAPSMISGQQLGSQSGAGGGDVFASAQAVEKLSLAFAKMDMLVAQLAQAGVTSVQQLPAEHEAALLLRQVAAVVAGSASRDETPAVILA